ncbi:virulence factor [endosymbiont of Acanthamoeba sp. UWC8]|uniref:murein biosynthesis integral membrane protein MurJ n=1 Tax=endosymbiont of Acanthamoeba sp. UWC8 TaxID=86106 RepID=UPI0004D119E0|nr:murein biosynthesis integral membrane protein MurJ [endosymbiont of Acanthamoeba sp. UWC8]AIF81055.1 virulence factor [endosymbiont of Acanthamoeba sp. UWC8]
MFLRSALVVSLTTLISRFFGYIRDVILAAQLGAGIYNDIFIIIFRMPNFFRTIFGEGAFSASFIPLYSGILETEGKLEAQKFASRIQGFLLIALIIFCGLIFIFMPELIKFTAPGLKGIDNINLAVSLSRVSISYLALISFVAFYGGILNSRGKYFAFAAAPVILNLVLIFFALKGNSQVEKLHWLSYGIVVAGVAELIWMIIFLYKEGCLVRFAKLKLTEDIRTMARRIVPGIIGSGVAQINVLVDTVIASFIPSALSYLYYADRINQLPLALIGTTMGIVMLPMLAKAFKRGDIGEGIRLQNQAISFLLFISIPASFALFILAFELVEVLFERDAFTSLATNETAKALMAFSLGLPAYSLVKIFVANYHAGGDTKTPVKIAFICVLSNALFSIILLQYLKHVGIALASSISAWINISLLWLLLKKRGKFKLNSGMSSKIIKYIISAIVMTISIYLLKRFTINFKAYVSLSILITFGGLIYLLSVIITKATSLREIKSYFKR